MTANPTPATSEPQGTSVDIQAVLARYSQELADATQRRILAETALEAAQADLAALRALATQPSPADEPDPQP